MRPLAVLGAGLLIAGFVVLFDRGLAGLFDLSYTFVTVVGALAVVQGLRYASGRRGTDHVSLDLGEPERRETVPVPGDDLDARIQRTRGLARATAQLRDRVRDRIREVVRAELVASRNLTVEEAETAIEEGSWTDDRTAAAFLSPAVAFPLRSRLYARMEGETTFEYGLRRALDALEDED